MQTKSNKTAKLNTKTTNPTGLSPSGLSYFEVMKQYRKEVKFMESLGNSPRLKAKNKTLYKIITGTKPSDDMTNNQLSYLMQTYRSEHRFVGIAPIHEGDKQRT